MSNTISKYLQISKQILMITQAYYVIKKVIQMIITKDKRLIQQINK